MKEFKKKDGVSLLSLMLDVDTRQICTLMIKQ